MESVAPKTELDLFQQFLSDRYSESSATIDDVVSEFRVYQQEREDLRAKLAKARMQCANGEARPLDRDDVMQRLQDRLDRKRQG